MMLTHSGHPLSVSKKFADFSHNLALNLQDGSLK